MTPSPNRQSTGGLKPEAFHLGQPRERSINAIQQIYTIVVGIGLTGGVQRLIEPHLESGAESWLTGASLAALALFGTLVVTLVPFYHGALRHLDDTYLFHDPKQPPKRFAILIEFFSCSRRASSSWLLRGSSRTRPSSTSCL